MMWCVCSLCEIWTSVWGIIDVNTAVRIWWVVTDAAVHRDISNTTSGTSV